MCPPTWKLGNPYYHTAVGTTASPGGGGCRDLTLDECEGEKPFNTLKNVGQDYCQEICKEVYSDKCTFFIYDGEDELCELYDYAEENYEASCKRIGGRPTPTLEECQTSPDPCVVRKLYGQTSLSGVCRDTV